MEEPGWYEFAACKGQTEIFYSERSEDIAVAKSICAECAIRLLCLDYAMTRREHQGIWGGKTDKERSSVIRRAQRRARLHLN